MIGLAYIVFFAVYGFISYKVVLFAGRWAKEQNKNQQLWSILAAVFMYHLVFWDLIPIVLIKTYYCATEGGLTVYKTPEQWLLENPGEVLVGTKELNRKTKDGKVIWTLNNRISWIIQFDDLPLSLSVKHDLLVDTKNHEVLVERGDVRLGVRNWVVSGFTDFRSLKPGYLELDRCLVTKWNRQEKWQNDGKAFSTYQDLFTNLGKNDDR